MAASDPSMGRASRGGPGSADGRGNDALRRARVCAWTGSVSRSGMGSDSGSGSGSGSGSARVRGRVPVRPRPLARARARPWARVRPPARTGVSTSTSGSGSGFRFGLEVTFRLGPWLWRGCSSGPLLGERVGLRGRAGLGHHWASTRRGRCRRCGRGIGVDGAVLGRHRPVFVVEQPSFERVIVGCFVKDPSSLWFGLRVGVCVDGAVLGRHHPVTVVVEPTFERALLAGLVVDPALLVLAWHDRKRVTREAANEALGEQRSPAAVRARPHRGTSSAVLAPWSSCRESGKATGGRNTPMSRWIQRLSRTRGTAMWAIRHKLAWGRSTFGSKVDTLRGQGAGSSSYNNACWGL